MAEQKTTKAVRIRLEVPPELSKGVYANFLNVAGTEHEFVFTFALIAPEGVTPDEVVAQAVARIYVPLHLLPRIVAAIGTVWPQLMETLPKELRATEATQESGA